jgi:SAM-dependent methyltransferase
MSDQVGREPLAIEYVDDRVAALRELRRVLRPGGALVFSRMHPTGDWLRHGGSYFDLHYRGQRGGAGHRLVARPAVRSGPGGWEYRLPSVPCTQNPPG